MELKRRQCNGQMRIQNHGPCVPSAKWIAGNPCPVQIPNCGPEVPSSLWRGIMDCIIAYPPHRAVVGVPRAADACSILLLTLSLTTFMCPLKRETHVQLGLNTRSALRQDVPARHQLIAAILKACMKGRQCKTSWT